MTHLLRRRGICCSGPSSGLDVQFITAGPLLSTRVLRIRSSVVVPPVVQYSSGGHGLRPKCTCCRSPQASRSILCFINGVQRAVVVATRVRVQIVSAALRSLFCTLSFPIVLGSCVEALLFVPCLMFDSHARLPTLAASSGRESRDIQTGFLARFAVQGLLGRSVFITLASLSGIGAAGSLAHRIHLCSFPGMCPGSAIVAFLCDW